jgi:hypothetical protein
MLPLKDSAQQLQAMEREREPEAEAAPQRGPGVQKALERKSQPEQRYGTEQLAPKDLIAVSMFSADGWNQAAR